VLAVIGSHSRTVLSWLPLASSQAAAAQAYPATCGQRAEKAAKVRKRDLLEAQLDACQQAERRADQDRQMRAHAARLVTEAGAACELVAGTPEDTFSVLEKWPTRRGERISAERVTLGYL
jgi:hypothetical protein